VEHPLDRHVKLRVQIVAPTTPCQAVEMGLFELENQFKSFQDNSSCRTAANL
jgi:DNA-directed RNA polymerase subunit L